MAKWALYSSKTCSQLSYFVDFYYNNLANDTTMAYFVMDEIMFLLCLKPKDHGRKFKCSIILSTYNEIYGTILVGYVV